MNIILDGGENLIKEGKANKSSLLGAQGGTLYLTNQKLSFLGHGMNVGKNAANIELKDIISYGKANTFVIVFPIPIPNAFKVVTKQGKTYKFTVNGRKKWIEELGKALSNRNN